MIYESYSDNETCEENSKINENDNSTNNNVLRNLTNKLAAINFNEINTSTRPKIKVSQTIDFTIDNIPYKGEIIGRAAKATGKYKNAFNIEYKEPVSMYNQQGYVDFDKVNDIVINENKTEQIMLTDENCFQKAKLYELNSWKTNNVYEEIPYSNQSLMHVKWVCTMKESNSQQIPKARLIVKSFEEPSKDEILKDSLTCSKETLRVVLFVGAQKKWHLNSIDVKTAFLQGENIDRELYILPPKEANTGKIWRLNKCPYGLVDASRKWYVKVKDVLISLDVKMSKADPSLFYYHHNNEPQGIIAIHVDDFLWCGNDYFFRNVIEKIHNQFIIGKEFNTAFRYLGLDLKEYKDHILLDQTHYIDSLNTVNIKDENLSIHDKLQSAIGKLIWISGQMRPDISFDVCQLATNLKNATISDVKYFNKIICHLKQSNNPLKFQHLGDISKLRFIIYADAAHGNLVNSASQEGYLIFIVGENNKCILLNWQSKRIRRVVRGSLAAETLALSDAVDNGIYLSKMLSELLSNDTYCIPIEVVTDSKSLYDARHSKKNVLEKFLRIDIALLKEFIDNKSITKIHYVPSQNQIANVLTKKGASSKELLDSYTKESFHCN